MAKTIISALSAQLLPTFLLIKDLLEKGDTLYFITTDKYNKTDALQRAINVQNPPKINIKILSLENGTENDWGKMLNKLSATFSDIDRKYIVNLTGGTKLESLALYSFFKDKEKAQLLYLPISTNHNCIDLKTEKKTPISYQANLEEYLHLCSLETPKVSNFLFSNKPDYAEKFFDKWKYFNEDDIRILRDLKRVIVRNNPLEKLPWETVKDDPMLKVFLEKIEYPLSVDEFGNLNKDKRKEHISFLNGLWFEELIRWRLSEALKVSIQNGEIKVENAEKSNELDCIFMLNNKCFIIECKTILKWDWVESAIDKANRINKSIIKTLSAKSYFFYLNKEETPQNKIEKAISQAEHIGIAKFFGKEYFTDNEKFQELVEIIKKDSLD